MFKILKKIIWFKPFFFWTSEFLLVFLGQARPEQPRSQNQDMKAMNTDWRDEELKNFLESVINMRVITTTIIWFIYTKMS